MQDAWNPKKQTEDDVNPKMFLDAVLRQVDRKRRQQNHDDYCADIPKYIL